MDSWLQGGGSYVFQLRISGHVRYTATVYTCIQTCYVLQEPWPTRCSRGRSLFIIVHCVSKNAPTLKRYSSKLYESILWHLAEIFKDSRIVFACFSFYRWCAECLRPRDSETWVPGRRTPAPDGSLCRRSTLSLAQVTLYTTGVYTAFYTDRSCCISQLRTGEYRPQHTAPHTQSILMKLAIGTITHICHPIGQKLFWSDNVGGMDEYLVWSCLFAEVWCLRGEGQSAPFPPAWGLGESGEWVSERAYTRRT